MLICWNYVKIIVNLTEILSSWLEIENLRNGQLGSFGLLCCAPASICKTTGHGK
jgi:hypothetical protein